MDLTERLTYLGEILVALSSSPVPSHQFQTLADHAGMAIPCDYLAVCLVDPDERGYLVHSLAGLAAGAIPPRSFRLSEGIAGHVLRSNRMFCTTDLATSPEGTPDLEGVCSRLGLGAALVVPIRQGEKALGALFFAVKPPVVYDADDIQIGKLMAAGLSSALETARLYQALADERSTLAAVLSSIQDAVLVVNEQGFVLLANPAVNTMLGLDPLAVTGKPLLQVVADPALHNLFAQKQPGFMDIALPGGGIAQANLVPVTTNYGEAVGWAAIFRDVTLFKELEQMKNTFVQTVSHDLKNPINVMILASHMIGRIGPLNEQQAEIRERLVRTADYMNDLVTDLLDLGKIEAGLELKAEPFDLVQLAQETVSSLAPMAEAKGQQLTAVFRDAVTVTADRRRLQQVLLNLIGNALKYTSNGGEIHVIINKEGSLVRVQVKDNGIGIAVKDLPYVFDKFYRVENQATRGIKGSGLGLAIARSIIEAYGGYIQVESVYGEGSTFTFTLPAT